MEREAREPPARRAWPDTPLERLSVVELLRGIIRTTVLLLRKEKELARAEARADLHDGVAMMVWLVAAAVCALLALDLLLVALVFALAEARILAG